MRTFGHTTILKLTSRSSSSLPARYALLHMIPCPGIACPLHSMQTIYTRSATRVSGEPTWCLYESLTSIRMMHVDYWPCCYVCAAHYFSQGGVPDRIIFCPFGSTLSIEQRCTALSVGAYISAWSERVEQNISAAALRFLL